MTGSRRRDASPGRGSTILTALAGALALLLAACSSTPDYLYRDAQERRLEKAGVEAVDPSGTASDAGLSILRKIEVEALDPEVIGADTASPGYHRYLHRCGTCHAAPSPRLRTSDAWRGFLPRMEKQMEESGLLPLGEEDRQLILEFLARHAASR